MTAGVNRQQGPNGRASPLAAVERHYQIALLGLVASGYLAIVTGGLLDLPATILTGLALSARVLIVAGILRWTPPEWFEARAGLCYLAFYPIDWYFLSKDSVVATVHLLLFLGAVRLFTAKTPRDFRFVQTLALLQMLAATLSASVYFLVFLASFLMFGIATLAGAEVLRSGSKPPLIVRSGLKTFGWRLTGLTFFIASAIVVIAGGLFFVLPRSAHAAFRHLAPFRTQFPGLSNVVSLGAIGEIQQSESVLLHVRITTDRVSSAEFRPASLKWRGMILNQFDGHRWTQANKEAPMIHVEKGFAKLGDRTPHAPWFQYEVRMQDLDSDLLFLAGRPQMVGLPVTAIYGSSDTGYRVPGRAPGPFAYSGYSVLEEPGATHASLTEEERSEYLSLPPTDPRVGELARDWVHGGSESAWYEARAIERHLRNDFKYTLELPARETPDPLAHFLFERRKGHCEYFASAMAVMLRERGIPSRVVTGFQSGVMNPLNGWLILRASDAHSWVEAWVEGWGWVTFDPTPLAPGPAKAEWLQQTRFYLDAFEVFWSEWVVGYDFDRQLRLAVEMHDTSRAAGGSWLDRLAAGATWLNTDFPRYAQRWWMPVAVWSLAGVVLIFALASFWKLVSGRGRLARLKSGGGQRSDATLLYQRALRALGRRGIDKHGWVTAGEFARSLGGSEIGRIVTEITALYNRLRFGGDAGAAARMFELVARLEKLP
jgi:hypothetical protein